MLLETEFIADEIAYYQKEFANLGATVDLLSYLWGDPEREFVCDIDSPLRPVRDIHTVKVSKCVTQVSAEDYGIVIMVANYCAVRLREIPPMHSLGDPSQLGEAPAVKFFAAAMRNPKIVKGAMCHALWILTPIPELLKGRKVICHTVVLADIYNAGATFVPAESHVVVDDDLVTARSFADVVPYFQAVVDTYVQRQLA
ncbi:MAG TPA: DJ-1/PfpI family protein [Chthoniobacteraceae bacterium]|nr:DJ-1/PfpI family protein [Chthoniobacteraceae bacterium]